MPHPTKIATCCYCGTRAALVLKGQVRHELSCAGCGAPLHDLKIMPAGQGEAHPQRPLKAPPAYHKAKKPKKKNRKKKSPARKLFSEAFDLIEDIFD